MRFSFSCGNLIDNPYFIDNTNGIWYLCKQYCICEQRLMACINFSGRVNVCLKQSFSFSIQVTISFREYEDNAIWIRIAWGTPYTKPNQYKTSYVVYHSQTPYVFISASTLRSNLPLLCQVENQTAWTVTPPQSFGFLILLALKRRCKDESLNAVF